MIAPWRPVALAVALNVTVMAGAVVAQSVTVMKGSPGTTVEVAMNTAVVGKATVDDQGRASVALGPTAMAGRTAINVRLYVDTCEGLRRVVVVESTETALAADTCGRRDIPGVYRLLPQSSFVVDIGTDAPSVRLRQGEAPREWFEEPAERPKGLRYDWAPRPGVMFFAGGGLGSLSHPVSQSCGSVTDCKGGSNWFAGTAGTTVWLFPFLGLEGSYVKHLDVTTKGKASSYSFDSSYSSHVAEGTIKLGWAFNRVRPYLSGGFTYTWSTLTTTEKVEDTTVTVDDTYTVTIPGGTQTLELRTKGWGWTAGAGMEIPVAKLWNLYTEVGRRAMNGHDIEGGENQLDERMTYWVVGVKIRLGK